MDEWSTTANSLFQETIPPLRFVERKDNSTVRRSTKVVSHEISYI
ncbi:hypothetical protein [Persicobacter psychrovividus]|uniref:Uncharacterized protein n=1 Tax=Persicobacter psychrovividus TaxID=387638 RepID=A0ABN6LFY1_9BACT|nr:hypothetical protein PEPS_26720 [Persicobacter psychrovividus]